MIPLKLQFCLAVWLRLKTGNKVFVKGLSWRNLCRASLRKLWLSKRLLLYNQGGCVFLCVLQKRAAKLQNAYTCRENLLMFDTFGGGESAFFKSTNHVPTLEAIDNYESQLFVWTFQKAIICTATKNSVFQLT